MVCSDYIIITVGIIIIGIIIGIIIIIFIILHNAGQIGGATSNGNEAKLKMKHPSDILKPGAIDMWPTTLPVRSWRGLIIIVIKRPLYKWHICSSSINSDMGLDKTKHIINKICTRCLVCINGLL